MSTPNSITREQLIAHRDDLEKQLKIAAAEIAAAQQKHAKLTGAHNYCVTLIATLDNPPAAVPAKK